MVSSCRCNRSTFTQLFCNKTSLGWHFKYQWSEGRVLSTGSWTTFNHDEFGNRNNGHIMESSMTTFSNDQCFFEIFWLILDTACALCESLHGYIQVMQSTFSEIEQKPRIWQSVKIINNKQEENTTKIMRMIISVVPALLTHLFNFKSLLRSLKAKVFLSLLTACFLPCQNTRKLIKRWMVYLNSFISYESMTLEETVKRASNLIKSYTQNLKEVLVKNLCSLLNCWKLILLLILAPNKTL